MSFVPDVFTSALLHCNGANNGTTFTDESGKTWTANGNSKTDNSQFKFGSTSARFDGVSGDYISTPNTTDLQFTGDFTIDLWCKLNTIPAGSVYFLHKSVVPGEWYLGFAGSSYSPSNALAFSIMTSPGSGFLLLVSSIPMNNTNWNHLAVVRSVNNWYMFVNGVNVSSASSATLYISTNPVYIGAEPLTGIGIDGWVDEVRISKGIARWTANFTPPTYPYGYTSNNIAVS